MKEWTACVFEDEGVFMDCSFLKVKAVCSFQTSDIRNRAAHRNESED
jgi:hypothetical protein